MRIFRMTIECTSPLHCGTDKHDPLQDQPVVRDAFGNYIIPGTAIAGILRNLAIKEDAVLAQKLFGSSDDGASLF